MLGHNMCHGTLDFNFLSVYRIGVCLLVLVFYHQYTRMMFIKHYAPNRCLCIKGGQINNVQLITGLRIAKMSQLQNCSVMCTKNGGYCENEKKKEKKSGGRGMCTKNGSYCEKEKKSGGRGQGRCERRIEA